MHQKYLKQLSQHCLSIEESVHSTDSEASSVHPPSNIQKLTFPLSIKNDKNIFRCRIRLDTIKMNNGDEKQMPRQLNTIHPSITDILIDDNQTKLPSILCTPVQNKSVHESKSSSKRVSFQEKIVFCGFNESGKLKDTTSDSKLIKKKRKMNDEPHPNKGPNEIHTIMHTDDSETIAQRENDSNLKRKKFDFDDSENVVTIYSKRFFQTRIILKQVVSIEDLEQNVKIKRHKENAHISSHGYKAKPLSQKMRTKDKNQMSSKTNRDSNASKSNVETKQNSPEISSTIVDETDLEVGFITGGDGINELIGNDNIVCETPFEPTRKKYALPGLDDSIQSSNKNTSNACDSYLSCYKISENLPNGKRTATVNSHAIKVSF